MGSVVPPDRPTGEPHHADLRPVGIVVTAVAALGGGLAWIWLHVAGSAPGPGAAALCSVPALVSFALALTARDDRLQYVARLLAAAVMLPILLAMWAASEPAAEGRMLSGIPLALAGTGIALLQLLAWTGLFLWVARYTTRIEPGGGTEPVSVDLLLDRIASLAVPGSPVRMEPGPQAHTRDLHLDVSDDGTRWHRVRLSIDAARHEVRVLEDLGASGTLPQSADEASLRAAGEPQWDPTRPDAQQVYGRLRQATMIEPSRLAAMPLAWHDDPRQPGPGLQRLREGLGQATAEARGEFLLTLLAALVTRSGWTWQPAMRAGRPRC